MTDWERWREMLAAQLLPPSQEHLTWQEMIDAADLFAGLAAAESEAERERWRGLLLSRLSQLSQDRTEAEHEEA